jgi:hypothetical protein
MMKETNLLNNQGNDHIIKAEELFILREHTNPFLLNTDIKNMVECANCVLMKGQMEDAILQMNSLTELL